LPDAFFVQYKYPAEADVPAFPFESAVARRLTENEAEGADVTRATTAIVSPLTVPDGKVKLTVIAFVSPARSPVVPENEIAEGTRNVELAGTKESNPIPIAETATSAMRLSVVFVDIDFLSLVDQETISRSAW